MVSGLLTLLHMTGELMMLSQMYRPPAGDEHIAEARSYKVDQLQSEGVDCLACHVSDGLVDLSSLYHGWSKHRWRKLHQFISNSQCCHLQLCWVCTHSVNNFHILIIYMFAYFTLRSVSGKVTFVETVPAKISHVGRSQHIH